MKTEVSLWPPSLCVQVPFAEISFEQQKKIVYEILRSWDSYSSNNEERTKREEAFAMVEKLCAEALDV